MPAPHAKLAEPTPYAGHVSGRPGRLVALDGLGELPDGMALLPLLGMQDAKVLRRAGLGPRVGMPPGGLGQEGPVLVGQANAVRR
jgi:hypothetical protein